VEASSVAIEESYRPCAAAEWSKKMNGIRSVVDLEDLLPFYLALNAAKYHNLNPHRRPLRAYLGHPHGHQDVAVVPLHSFLHDDERVIFVNRVPHGCRIVGRFGILLVKLNALKLVEHPRDRFVDQINPFLRATNLLLECVVHLCLRFITLHCRASQGNYLQQIKIIKIY
jgi:hypothetical protein